MSIEELQLLIQLASRRQIAIVWSTDDIRQVRPDLTDDQCWKVLQEAERQHDAMIGMSCDTLIWIADDLFGLRPCTKAGDDDQ
ncbi:hypothetical protein GC163_23755 [bacterium]|nr:hypothetical protein [bacterium]